MLNYAFTYILFSLRILLFAVEMSDRASQTNGCQGPYIGSVLLRMLFEKVCEENAVNDLLFASSSNYREVASKLTGISNKTISCIKAAGSENAVLAPRKP